MAPSQLQIKTNALQRLTKESVLYSEELKEHEEQVQKLEAQVESDKDNEELKYSLKTAIKIRDETSRMVPHIKAKIQEIVDDIKSYLKSNPSENDETVKKILEEI
ncbi:DEKNAAC102625 [Brettanomyces naardenensis]|uniref:Tubulin-specific chaperone A n=1 Tax=Brettanomyces naardenensis TaxID=13370 RepID=A0A448YLN0_BRENA|nr:DEKNAAC102625 [Brettanomyces naardenensis]